VRALHHPTIKTMERGRLDDCPECRRDALGGQLPIGLGMLLESKLTAERLRANHAGRPIATAS
jgi:hypothetical protein